MFIGHKGSLRKHTEELEIKSESVIRETKKFGSKEQDGKEKVCVKLTLFKICYRQALTYAV